MSNTQVHNETGTETPRTLRVDMPLEVVVIPVSDVDRAKRFYGGLGWRLDADFAASDQSRGVQFTPPGSPCSIIFGQGITSAVPGSAQGSGLLSCQRPRHESAHGNGSSTDHGAWR
jgi:catechol 2,3-dioxygenase-like lactoylglutathione lyase family enzyme